MTNEDEEAMIRAEAVKNERQRIMYDLRIWNATVEKALTGEYPETLFPILSESYRMRFKQIKRTLIEHVVRRTVELTMKHIDTPEDGFNWEHNHSDEILAVIMKELDGK